VSQARPRQGCGGSRGTPEESSSIGARGGFIAGLPRFSHHALHLLQIV